MDAESGFLISTLKKISALSNWSNNSSANDVTMHSSILEEKLSFKILKLSFSSKFDFDSYVVSIAKKVP